jgi:ribosomal protein S18 acetylase RimI-like enzyme
VVYVVTISVRKLTEYDARELAAFIVESYGTGTGTWFSSRPSEKEAELVVANKLKMQKKSKLIDNVAVVGGRIAGDCEIIIEKGVGLLGIIVAPGYRGSGVGRAVLMASLTDALTRGIHVIVAETEENNYSALSFFRKNGFMAVGAVTTVKKNGTERKILRLELRL